MPVDVRSRRLPPLVRDLEPRIVLELQQLDDRPVRAADAGLRRAAVVRIDDGRMVYLQGPVPVRDEAAERRLIHRLRDELDLVPGRRVTLRGRGTCARFASKLRRWRGRSDRRRGGLVSRSVRLAPRLRSTPAATPATATPSCASTCASRCDRRRGRRRSGSVDAGAVVRAWQEGLGLVPLEGGGWAPLPLAWLAKHGQRVADLLAAREADGRVASHALPALAALCDELEHPPPPGLERLAPAGARASSSCPRRALPARSHGDAAPLPAAGRRLARASCAAPAWAACSPTTWASARRCRRWRCCARGPHAGGLPDQRAAQLAGGAGALPPRPEVSRLPRRRRARSTRRRRDADHLRAPAPRRRRRWPAQRAGTPVVLDEAQAIKNPDSQVARAAYALPADFRLALTGTPVENRLEELWSLMHFTNRGLLGGRRDFDGALRPPDRRRRRRARREELRAEDPPVRAAPAEAGRRARAAAAHRGGAARRARRARARRLRRGARGDAGEVVALLRGQGRRRDGGAGGAAAAAPGRLPPRAGARRRAGAHVVEGRAAGSRRSRPRVAEGHKALVFSQWTSLLDLIEPRAAGGRARLRAPRRQHPRPGRGRRPLPGRRTARR